jgi:hypothetical protein
MLGQQISGKPIDHAILQMMFSEKRASKRIKSMLVLAREHALRYKGLNHSKLVVCAPVSYLFSWLRKLTVVFSFISRSMGNERSITTKTS